MKSMADKWRRIDSNVGVERMSDSVKKQPFGFNTTKDLQGWVTLSVTQLQQV